MKLTDKKKRALDFRLKYSDNFKKKTRYHVVRINEKIII